MKEGKRGLQVLGVFVVPPVSLRACWRSHSNRVLTRYTCHMAMLGFGITGYSENKSLLTQHKKEVEGRSSFDD
jgi:hypothetical protein